MSSTPSQPTIHAKIQLAVELHQQGRIGEAERIYEEVLRQDPNNFDALHLLGVVAFQTKRFDRSVNLIAGAVALAPNAAPAQNNLGNSLAALKRHQEALACFDKAIALNSDYAEAYYNRGIALQYLKRYADALASYDKAIALGLHHAEALCSRASVLSILDRPQEALASYEKARALKPDIPLLLGELIFKKMTLCDWHNFAQDIAEISRRIGQGERASTPFPLVAAIASPVLQKKAAEIYSFAKFPANDALGPIPVRPKHDKIRIGYFSGDFRNHATAFLTAELFEKHDRTRFEWTGFSFGDRANDEMQQRLGAAFDRFIDVRDLSDEQVAMLARQLEIDIAVDLKGYTQGHRLGIFSYRAAPLQVGYLGYPGTMGAGYMDYLIADKTLIPVSDQVHYSEKIVYLPDSYQANDTKRAIAEQTLARVDAGLPENAFVFCCFNSSYKILPDTFDRWMRILHAVDRSVLWLFETNKDASQRLKSEARSRGVDGERLVFASLTALPQHLARHRLADLFLDTLPCNAHTTASDALWAGLPVLTQCGGTFAGRVASSLLNAVGLPELITTSPEAYEALAIELAANRSKLAALKRKLDGNRLSTPLFDIRRFAKNMEAAYAAMVERHRAGLAPDHIIVPSDA